MSTILELGMYGRFLVTFGYGSPTAEPEPTPKAEGVTDNVLGQVEGGLFASTESPVGLEVH